MSVGGENVTEVAEPEISVAVTVETALPPLTTLALVVEREKSKGAFTVKVKAVVLVRPPPVATIVIILAPKGVVDEVVMFKVLEQMGLHVVSGDKEKVVPTRVGREKVTGVVVPETIVAVIVEEVLLPLTTPAGVEAETEKSNETGQAEVVRLGELEMAEGFGTSSRVLRAK